MVTEQVVYRASPTNIRTLEMHGNRLPCERAVRLKVGREEMWRLFGNAERACYHFAKHF